MPLVQKGVSLATSEASRYNGSKSRGPLTQDGKDYSRINAGKHWGRAEEIRPLMRALGEDPVKFERVREGLYNSLGPRDDFEAMVVDDMAEIHWHLRRMLRGEAAAQAARRREYLADHEESEAKIEAGRLHDLEPFTVSTLGFAGLHDSPPKFQRILQILNALHLFISGEGFLGEGVVYLKTIYGSHNPGLRAKRFITEYQRCCDQQGSADDATREANRAAFLQDLEAEIAWFEQRAASNRQARADLEIPHTEAQLLKAGYDMARVMFYQEALERQFERKWQLLRRHRQAREDEAAREAMIVETETTNPSDR